MKKLTWATLFTLCSLCFSLSAGEPSTGSTSIRVQKPGTMTQPVTSPDQYRSAQPNGQKSDDSTYKADEDPYLMLEEEEVNNNGLILSGDSDCPCKKRNRGNEGRVLIASCPCQSETCDKEDDNCHCGEESLA